MRGPATANASAITPAAPATTAGHRGSLSMNAWARMAQITAAPVSRERPGASTSNASAVWEGPPDQIRSLPRKIGGIFGQGAQRSRRGTPGKSALWAKMIWSEIKDDTGRDGSAFAVAIRLQAN